MNAASLVEQERARHPGASNVDCVRQIATRVIDELGIDEPPIDVEMVASYLGIADITQDPQLVEAGCLICDGTRVSVRIRQSDAATRQRFTLCHESAHTFFPGFDRQPQYRCDPDAAGADAARPRRPRTAQPAAVPNQPLTGRTLEQLCDVAASELLLPQRLFAADVQDAAFGLHSLEELSDRYDASLEATARRFVALTPEATALVIFRLTQSPRERHTTAEPRLRVVTTSTTGTWPFIPTHKSANDHSPFMRALWGEAVHEMTQINDIMSSPELVEVSARAYPYFHNGERVDRVLALMRRPRSPR